MTIGQMTDIAEKRMLGFDLEMLTNAYEQMWVDFFYTKKNTTLNTCAQMYIIGLAMNKFDTARSEDMRAGAKMFATDLGHSAEEFQEEIETILYNTDKKNR